MKSAHKKKLQVILKQIVKIRKTLSDMSWEDGVTDHYYEEYQYFSGLLHELQEKFDHLFQEARE